MILKNLKTSIITLCSFFVVAFALNGCYKDNAEELYPGVSQCDTSNVTYSGTVSAILTKNCAFSGCHTSNNKPNVGGYAFDSYQETILAVPNKKLINSIKHVSGTSPMPKGGAKLVDCDINKITAWINQGTLNN